MAFMCDICDKKTMKGRSQQHARGVAGKRWRKRSQETIREFRPNIQAATFKIGEEILKAKVCAKCLKRVKKYNSIGNIENISVI